MKPGQKIYFSDSGTEYAPGEFVCGYARFPSAVRVRINGAERLVRRDQIIDSDQWQELRKKKLSQRFYERKKKIIDFYNARLAVDPKTTKAAVARELQLLVGPASNTLRRAEKHGLVKHIDKVVQS